MAEGLALDARSLDEDDDSTPVPTTAEVIKHLSDINDAYRVSLGLPVQGTESTAENDGDGSPKAAETEKESAGDAMTVNEFLVLEDKDAVDLDDDDVRSIVFLEDHVPDEPGTGCRARSLSPDDFVELEYEESEDAGDFTPEGSENSVV